MEDDAAHGIRLAIERNRKQGEGAPAHFVKEFHAYERALFESLHIVTGRPLMDLHHNFANDLRRGKAEQDDGGLFDTLTAIARPRIDGQAS